MYEKLNDGLNIIPGGIANDRGGVVWPLTLVSEVLDLALSNHWIVLGGDILTLEQEYTYDNWYYIPNPQKPLVENVRASIEKSRNYISQYVTKNGDRFLIDFSISNSFVGGR